MLTFFVLKVNGSDISHLSKYEAVQMFLQAKETLVVELCRQKDVADVAGSSANSEDPITAKLENLSLINQPNRTTTTTTTTSACAAAPPNVTTAASQKTNPVVLTLRADNQAAPIQESKQTQTVEDNLFNTNTSAADHNIVRTIADHFIEQEHHLFEQCLEPEIDIEEITLSKKGGTSDQLGLSVCYNNTIFGNSEDSVKSASGASNLISDGESDACLDVFISDIQPESIAELDGRLRRGDQILRINGKDIKSKEEAETQIAENSMAVTLLVSRLLYPEDEDDDEEEEYYVDSNFEYANSFLTDDYTNVVDKLDKVLLAQAQSMKAVQLTSNDANKSMELAQSATELNNGHIHTINPEKSGQEKSKTKTMPEPTNSQEKLSKSQSSTSKSKRQSSAAASLKSKLYEYDESEHIYETIPEDSETEPLYCSPYQSSTYITDMGSCSSATATTTIADDNLEQSQRVAQWLGIKSSSSTSSQANRIVHTLAGRPNKQQQQQQQQQQRIANRVSTLRCALTNTSGSSSSGHTAANMDNEHLNEDLDNSSSAYNTGGSNNSASPLVFALNKSPNILNQDNDGKHQGKLLLSPKEPFVTSPLSNMLPFLKSNSNQESTSAAQAMPSAGTADDLPTFQLQNKSMRLKQTEEQPQPHSYCPCPQFNAPNLSRYHFVSSQEVSTANKCQNSAVPKTNSILVTTKAGTEEIPMVWKVKRRPDGTRYIVKRPVRNRVQVGGIRRSIRNNEVTTTEDDTISEVKIGRYWTKEERKRHIERARERRQHQQQQFTMQ